ncbi:MAG: DUF2088 domain-containing protein [Chloroflexota bacterium]
MNFYQQIQQLNFPAPLPHTLLRVEQRFDCPLVEDIAADTANALNQSGILSQISPGDSVALGVGSRGIANLATVVKAAVDTLKGMGAEPFIIPAMGSHAGATAEGQTEMLHNLGVTPEVVGAEIRATMEVREIGQLADGPPLYQDIISHEAEHSILINRVKPHTSFRSKIESGLAKMAVIGLGKQHGAATMHANGVEGLKTYLAPASRIYEKETNLRGGLAIVENAYDETAEIVGLTAAEIGADKEAQLLEKAKSLMASLPFPEIDVLVVRELGKNISGTGMDTNVIKRLKIPRQVEPTDGPDISTITVLDLTEATHGNSNGMGLANVVTARLASKVDWQAIYTNSLTSGVLGMWRASMPMTMADDKRAIQAAIIGCGEPAEEARLAFIRNTLTLDELWVSPNLSEAVENHPRLTGLDEVPLTFDEDGAMTSPWKLR